MAVGVRQLHDVLKSGVLPCEVVLEVGVRHVLRHLLLLLPATQYLISLQGAVFVWRNDRLCVAVHKAAALVADISQIRNLEIGFPEFRLRTALGVRLKRRAWRLPAADLWAVQNIVAHILRACVVMGRVHRGTAHLVVASLGRLRHLVILNGLVLFCLLVENFADQIRNLSILRRLCVRLVSLMDGLAH